MPLKLTDSPQYAEAWTAYCMAYKGKVSAKHVHAFAAGLQKFVELMPTPIASLVQIDMEKVEEMTMREHENETACLDPLCPIHRVRK